MAWLLQCHLRDNPCSPAIKSGRGARRGDSARTSRLFNSPLCTSGGCSVTVTCAKFGSVRTQRAEELFLLLQPGARGQTLVAPKCGSLRRHEVAHNAVSSTLRKPLPGLCLWETRFRASSSFPVLSLLSACHISSSGTSPAASQILHFPCW